MARARFFLDKAIAAGSDERIDVEAFLEASIVFGRTAFHRFQTVHRKHAAWSGWLKSMANEPAMNFFRRERDQILKEGPPKIGQKIGMPSIGPGGTHIPAAPVSTASEFYYFDDPAIPATTTVDRHLRTLERLLDEAQKQLS